MAKPEQRDIKLPSNAPTKLLVDKHCDFILGYGKEHDQHAYAMTDQLRLSGVYWSLTALDIMKTEKTLDRDVLIDLTLNKCWDTESGGFRPWPKHDPHILFTLSAVQILVSIDAVDMLNKCEVARYVGSMQYLDGSFSGDRWGEVDSRFSFCALATLKLLGVEVGQYIRVDAAVNFIDKCQNFDGGFGLRPGSESHSGQIYCCLGFLSLINRLDVVRSVDDLAWWLCERQLEGSGGLNGRPEKLPDVCYSWWVLSSLSILNRLHWIDKQKLCKFILSCQDDESGGFSDRPGDMPDPFHTLFGITGLSLTGLFKEQLHPVNPVLCMRQSLIDNLNIETAIAD